jgi:hypothetical protein
MSKKVTKSLSRRLAIFFIPLIPQTLRTAGIFFPQVFPKLLIQLNQQEAESFPSLLVLQT